MGNDIVGRRDSTVWKGCLGTTRNLHDLDLGIIRRSDSSIRRSEGESCVESASEDESFKLGERLVEDVE